MKDMNMTEERQLIEAAQDAIASLKRALRGIEKINTEAGRLDAANAAMGGRGKVIVLHSELTKDMHQFFPEFAAEIQTRGGGR